MLNKEFEEVLKIVNDILNNFGGDKVQIETMTLSKCDILKLKSALIELKAIKESKPSEALKELELVENWIKDRGLKISNVIEPSLTTIKQYLLKAQEQEKVLNEIIKLIDDLEPTFNRKGVSSDTNILGTIIKDYFINNASELLKKYLNKLKRWQNE